MLYILSRKTLCEKACGYDLTYDAVSRCAQSVCMKVRPQSNRNESNATPTASAPSIPKVVRVWLSVLY